MTPVLYYILQFILGGASVVGITLIAKYLNPKYTGILYALPAILITAMIFIYVDQGLDIAKRTPKSTFVYEFTLVYFVLAWYVLLQRVDFWWALGIAFISWIVIAALIQVVVKL